MTTVLICGGREFCQDHNKPFATYARERQYATDRLDQLQIRQNPSMIIHGNAYGADKWCGNYMRDTFCIPTLAVPAEWKRYGKKAGWLRNTKMINLGIPVDLVVTFPGGIGTEMMLKIAIQHGIETVNLKEDWNEWITKNPLPTNTTPST